MGLLGMKKLTDSVANSLTQNEHPLHALRLDGRACKLYHNTEQYEAIERMEGLIPWKGGGGGQESLIDRFDGRAMLDMYIPHRPQPGRPKTEDELELEEVSRFQLTTISRASLAKCCQAAMRANQDWLVSNGFPFQAIFSFTI